jgi:hypothetical protein
MYTGVSSTQREQGRVLIGAGRRRGVFVRYLQPWAALLDVTDKRTTLFLPSFFLFPPIPRSGFLGFCFVQIGETDFVI